MRIAEIIEYISIIFWILPPFRQYKERYFYYFLILALSDPLALFSVTVLGFSPNYIHPVAGLLLFYSINTSLANLKKYWLLHGILISVFFFVLLYFDNLLYIVFIMHLLILFKFIHIIIIEMFNSTSLNAFNLALSFYEISVVINLTLFLSDIQIRFVMFYMTLFFQILLAIFFTIFTEKSDFLILKLRSDNWNFQLRILQILRISFLDNYLTLKKIISTCTNDFLIKMN